MWYVVAKATTHNNSEFATQALKPVPLEALAILPIRHYTPIRFWDRPDQIRSDQGRISYA